MLFEQNIENLYNQLGNIFLLFAILLFSLVFFFILVLVFPTIHYFTDYKRRDIKPIDKRVHGISITLMLLAIILIALFLYITLSINVLTFFLSVLIGVLLYLYYAHKRV